MGEGSTGVFRLACLRCTSESSAPDEADNYISSIVLKVSPCLRLYKKCESREHRFGREVLELVAVMRKEEYSSPSTLLRGRVQHLNDGLMPNFDKITVTLFSRNCITFFITLFRIFTFSVTGHGTYWGLASTPSHIWHVQLVWAVLVRETTSRCQ